MKKLWLCCALAAFVSAPALAQTAGKDGQPNPLDPQAEAPIPDSQKPGWMQYSSPYAGEQNDLTNPHRTAEEIAIWAQGSATDMLTFTASDMIAILRGDGVTDLPEEPNAKLARIKKKFSDQGWAEYAGFMRDKGIIDRVRQQGQSVTTVADGQGLVIDKGANGNSYRWTVRLPVMISFLAFDAMSGEQRSLLTAHYEITMQLARIPQKSPAEDGLEIEKWSGAFVTTDSQQQ